MPVFQFRIGSLGAEKPLPLGKFSIACGSVYSYWPLAESCGNATARVWITSPCDDSRSLCASSTAALACSAVLIASASDNGRDSHDGAFVSSALARCRPARISPTVNNVRIVFMFKITSFNLSFPGGKSLKGRQRKPDDMVGQIFNGRTVHRGLFRKKPRHHRP